MTRFNRSFGRWCTGAALGMSLLACMVGTAGVAAASGNPAGPTAPCATGLAVVVSSPSGDLQPACVTQQGNVLVIALAKDLGNTVQQPTSLNAQPPTVDDTPTPDLNALPDSLNGPAPLDTPPGTPTPTTHKIRPGTPTPTVTPVDAADSEPDMSAVTDPRIDSYAKRQAIRDEYRGQIDVTTFNDELGDGDPLETALHDALAAYTPSHAHP